MTYDSWFALPERSVFDARAPFVLPEYLKMVLSKNVTRNVARFRIWGHGLKCELQVVVVVAKGLEKCNNIINFHRRFFFSCSKEPKLENARGGARHGCSSSSLWSPRSPMSKRPCKWHSWKAYFDAPLKTLNHQRQTAKARAVRVLKCPGILQHPVIYACRHCSSVPSI